MAPWDMGVSRRKAASVSLATAVVLSAAILVRTRELARNYTDPRGPRYTGAFSHAAAGPALKVVTFNIRFAREIDRAAELLSRSRELRDADLLALQEMDAAGTERLARDLGYDYVYYPAASHPASGRDFGNAVLSRVPILSDRKVLLPYPSHWRHMQREAVAAEVCALGQRLRIYSVHLGTPLEVTPSERAAQALAIVGDARGAVGPVVIAGDFNNRDIVGQVFEGAGFRWVTRDLGATVRFFAWDHVFARGLDPGDAAERGIVLNNEGASDHLPVWTELFFPSPPPAAACAEPARARTALNTAPRRASPLLP
jgi:endonuclease/exonuclease/phosphatase family metal-dependent hydrolase